jgi:hypothetical protein
MRDYPTQTQTQVREPLVLVRKDMDVNEHEKLFNTNTNPSKGTMVLVRKDMDVNEHERLSNTDTNPSKGTIGMRKKGYGCK